MILKKVDRSQCIAVPISSSRTEILARCMRIAHPWESHVIVRMSDLTHKWFAKALTQSSNSAAAAQASFSSRYMQLHQIILPITRRTIGFQRQYKRFVATIFTFGASRSPRALPERRMFHLFTPPSPIIYTQYSEPKPHKFITQPLPHLLAH